MKLFVEGGGDQNPTLATECRQAFADFFKRAGIQRRPKVLPSGSRQAAFDDFCLALEQGEEALLLVDSEAPVAEVHVQGDEESWQPWQHLTGQDNWTAPLTAQPLHCHLMVQCMECWLLADRDALRKGLGSELKVNHLPQPARIEAVCTTQALELLKKASANCKRRYDKGRHSFKLLQLTDPSRVTEASPWARRLINHLRRA